MNPARTSPPRCTARWLKAGVVVLGLVSMVCFAAMIAFAVTMVQSGHGLEAHRTFWLVEDSWVGVLTFVACGTVAIGVGLVVRVVQKRRENQDWLQPDRK